MFWLGLVWEDRIRQDAERRRFIRLVAQGQTKNQERRQKKKQIPFGDDN
jgi:hypothetical protein